MMIDGHLDVALPESTNASASQLASEPEHFANDVLPGTRLKLLFIWSATTSGVKSTTAKPAEPS